MSWVDKTVYAVLIFGTLCLVLTYTEMYQTARRDADRNRVIAAELGAIKDIVGVSDATRQVIHATIIGLDTDDHSLWRVTFLRLIQHVADFVLIDVLNSRPFMTLLVGGILASGAYLVHGLRAK